MRIIVVGETCKDKFIYVETKRLSPEAPVPVLLPLESTENDGMSGNVVNNLKSLNKNLTIIHWHQDVLITKTRYVDKKSNHIFLRIDEGENNVKPLVLDENKIQELSMSDVVIVSDYNKGFLTNKVLFEITRHSKLSILDTKKQINNKLVTEFNFVKLNESEFLKHRFNKPSLDKLLITLGNRGAKHQGVDYPSPDPKETIDVSGAGDTFTASFTLKYMETHDVSESIIFANKMSSIVVSKRGVSTP